MSPKYDAFGRPIEPQAPRPAPKSAPSGRSQGASRARATPRTGASGSVPEVRGLPPIAGGQPVGTGPAKQQRARWSTAGALAVAAFVGLGVIGSLVDSDERSSSSSGSSASIAEPAPRAPLTALDAGRDMTALRGAMRPGERVVSVTLSSESASARVVGSGGRSRFLYVASDGVRDVDSSSSATRSAGVAVEDLNVAAPARLISSVLRGLGPGSGGSVRSVSASAYDDGPLRWRASAQRVGEDDRDWAGDDRGYAVVRTSDGAPAPAVGETGPARVPVGLAGPSLLRTTNLRAALETLRGDRALGATGDPRISSFDLEPVRIRTFVVGDGADRFVTVDAALGVDTSSFQSPATDLVPLSTIDPAGPERAIRAIGRRLSGDVSRRVESVSLSILSGSSADERVSWYVSLSGGGGDRTWRASLDGRRIGRSGEPLTR